MKVCIDTKRLETFQQPRTLMELPNLWKKNYTTCMRYVRKMRRLGFLSISKIEEREGKGLRFIAHFGLSDKGKKLLEILNT